MRSCALIPFKDFARCKQRLCGALDESQRQLLVAAMLEDTLRSVRASAQVQDFFLLSNDDKACSLARRLGWQCLAESAQATGLNGAVQAAAAVLAPAYDALLIIHADLPLLLNSEVDAIVTRHREAFAEYNKVLTLNGDRKGEGSNCLMISPPQALRFQYGSHSFEKHLALAAERGIQSTTLCLPGAAQDIDEADDLAALRCSAQLRAASATARALAMIGE